MLTSQNAHIFESVARGNPQYVELLKTQLEKHKDQLVKVVDVEQMKRIQGMALCLTELIGHLEHHKSPRKGSPT